MRLLLDDNNTGGMDEIIAALDGHAGIEVRLFNPFVYRGSRLLGYLADFRRLNHRMHNKSLTADNQATIVGGRNVGDEYFASGGHVVFQDLDVIGVGPVAAAVGADFDRYWNSGSAYPAGVIIARTKAGGTGELSRLFAQTRASAEASRYREAVAATTLVSDLLAHRLSLDWATTTLISDKPEKVAGQVQDQDLLFSRLLAAIGTPRREIDLISPYFVPGERGAADLATYPGRGVKLRIVTNSLAATDVGAVHAGYARRREALLRGGARIYELKPGAAATTRRGDRERHSAPGGSAGGSSTVSLHAKTFAVDRERVFVGSFNLDPRSARLNTEMGVLIDSPSLAGAVSNALDAKAALLSWEVVLGADGKRLAWVEQTPQGPVRHEVEPETGFFKRFGVRLMSLLPVEAML